MKRIMKRSELNENDFTLEKKTKLSSNFHPAVIFIKNDLDLFREQLPIVPAATTEDYSTKPLTYCPNEEKYIFDIFNHILPIEYHAWENSIVRHSNAINPSKSEEMGWIPTRECRTMATYQKEVLGRNVDYMENIRYDDRNRVINWYSIFPLNDAVILKNLSDNENFQFDLNYKLKYVNLQQDFTVSELSNELAANSTRKEKVTTQKKFNSFKHNKESRLHRTRNVLARVGLSGVLPDNHDDFYHHYDKYKETIKPKPISFWNLSNDFYYDCNSEQSFFSKRRINSTQNFDFVFYPIFRTANELRYFHRPILQFINHRQSWTSIQLADKNVSNQSIRVKSDLTGRLGEILLFEYSEQYPALLNESGMFSKIRTYLRPQHFKADMNSFEVDYGELIYTHASPFLWSIPRGLNIQTIENNIKNDFYIRNIDIIYIVGQECPLIEVPIPQSKRVNLFQRDLLQIYIYRLFLQSTEIPRRIRIEDIKRVFPRLAETSIRKRLKTSADFRRTEDEIQDLIKPEYCCAYASMAAAEQRLKDAGLCDKYNIDLDDDDDDDRCDYSIELNDEILQAPWNTTRAYLGALKGKCLMQAFGIGSKSIHKTRTNNDLKHLRRAVTGTDADLRRLQLKDARKLLLKFNISEKTIQSLTRWEIVDLVRTLSTQQAKEGINGGMIKFARGAKHLQAQQFEKYKENCQKQFELQNRLFNCTNEQSTDDEISNDSDELNEMSETLENLLRENQALSMSTERRKMLHITRTYIDNQGTSYQREEFFRNNDSHSSIYKNSTK
ncbi:hypothetical protein I4U23_002915 [Adineta vaga]|nr:hypothetical protein I4U23_002915 [Adineta vaga]